MNAILGRAKSFKRISWVAAALLLTLALLASCNTFRQPTPTPEPTATPRATQTPSATAVPSTATPEPPALSSGPVAVNFDITPETTWEELFSRFSAEEQSCIRSEISEAQLAAILTAPVMSEADAQPLVACLAPETVGTIVLAALVAEAGLTGDAAACLEEKLVDIDPAIVYVAMTDLDSDPAAQAALFAIFSGVQECALEGDLPDPGVGQPQIEVDALWSSSVGGLVVNSPALAYGVVYAGSDDGTLYAFDSATGEELWRYRTREAIRSTPTLADGVVYVGSNDNNMYAFDSGTGAPLWRYDTGSWVQYSPTVANGTVYLGASSEFGFTIHALDGVSGESVWISETPFTVSPGLTPTAVDDKVYGSGDLGQFYALDASSGELAWSFDTGIGGEEPPTVIDGVVYLTGVNAAYALDESTGALIWSFDTDQLPAREFAAVIEDGVYYFAPDNNVYALDISTGQPIWSHEFTEPNGMVATTPVVSNGIVYVGLESGAFHAIEAGNLVWSIQEDGEQLDSPLVAGGVLYVQASNAHLLALGPATGEELQRYRSIYFSDIQTYTVAEGIVLMGAPGGGVQALAAPQDPSSSAPPQEERVLTLRYWQAPSLPSSYLSGGTKDSDAGAITLEPLAHYNPEGDLLPVLAAEIPTVENGGLAADLMSMTWTLKERLMWSDGSGMTADDVVFTWLYCTHEDTGCTGEASFGGIASVEALDALTVRITFDAPTPYAYNAFVGSGVPIISRTQFADCVGTAATTCTEQNTAPLGTGPYRIVSFAVEEEAVYERNPFYRGEAPYFDRVVLTGGGDAASAASAVLETGSADYAWNVQVTPETLAMLEAGGLGTVATAYSSLVERLVLNQTNPDPALGENRSEYLDGANAHPFLTFAPIRQAMSMAIDRGLLAERLYGSAGQPTCNLITGPAPYVSTANDACLTQDIVGANKLLDDNGVLDSDSDGIREYNGTPLTITYQTTANAVRQDTQALIQDWWRQIGIETALIQHHAGVFFGGDPVEDAEGSYRRFFADVQMYANSPDINPQQYLSALRCSHIPTMDNNWADGNIARACNTGFDTLFTQLAETAGELERIPLIKRLNDTLVQSYYEIPLINRGFVSVYANTLEGVRINAWDTELWNIAEWRRSS